MPPPTTSSVSRKRTRSNNISESTDNHQQTTTTTTTTSTSLSSHPNSTAPPKRQRNNPPTTTRPNYSLRNRSTTSDSRQTSTRLPSIERPTTSQRYNLRPRISQSQVRLPRVSTPHPTTNPTNTTTTTATTANVSNRTRRQISSTTTNPTQQEQSTSSTVPSRPYRLVYISDDDDRSPTTTQASPAVVNTTFSLVTDNNNEESRRTQLSSRRLARSTNNISHNTRSRTTTEPTTIDNPDFTNNGVAHVRLDRAIEIVFDSIQSLEGATNNFDQLVIALIYGRLSTRTEFDTIEGMIRLSRILNLNFPSHLTQDEINALPKIKFLSKTDSSSVLLVEKCPICLTEFNDQEIINKLHCSHLFHLQCIGTWLSENDSCPTCRRKVNGD